MCPGESRARRVAAGRRIAADPGVQVERGLDGVDGPVVTRLLGLLDPTGTNSCCSTSTLCAKSVLLVSIGGR